MTVFSFSDLAFLAVAAGYTPTDTDAAAYITAVETADGQALEPGVRRAIDEFVIGCKADGIWNAIKASCIMAGARTLAGALVPLVGAAPTNFNFVSGDYNRKTGLVGDGSTKYLDSNRAANADPLNSVHLSCYVSSVGTTGITFIYDTIGAGTNGTGIGRRTDGAPNVRMRNANQLLPGGTVVQGFFGARRSSSTETRTRIGGVNRDVSQASVASTSLDYGIFADSTGSSATHTNSHLAFYSIGEALDLALLDARVTTLINAYAAAIP